MSLKTISVVMPNYNDANYVGAALKAICEQSFSPKEVIIVDDCSTDNSISVISDLIKQYPFIRLLRNETNRGTNYSVNRAIAMASGDYICFGSSNDLVLPDFFEKSMNLLAKYPQAAFCCTDTKIENVKEGIQYEKRSGWSSSPCYLSPQALAETIRFTEKIPYVWMNTALIRRDLLPKEQIFLPELEWHADWFLTQTLASKHGCCYIPEPLAVFRWLGDSYWYRGVNNQNRYRRVFTKLIQLLATPEYEDLSDFLIRSHSLRFVNFSVRTPTIVFQALHKTNIRNRQTSSLFWYLTLAYLKEAPNQTISYSSKIQKSMGNSLWRLDDFFKNLCEQLYALTFHQYHKLRSRLRGE